MLSFVSYYPFPGERSSTLADPLISFISVFLPEFVAFSSSQSLCGANHRDFPVKGSFVFPGLTRDMFSTRIFLLPYVRDDRHPNDIPLFGLECGYFLRHMCLLDAGLKASAHGRLSARDRYAQACGFHLTAPSGRTLLPATTASDLLFARSDDEYTFYLRLTLASEASLPLFGANFFCQWRGICSVSQSKMDQVYARSFIPVDFCNI